MSQVLLDIRGLKTPRTKNPPRKAWAPKQAEWERLTTSTSSWRVDAWGRSWMTHEQWRAQVAAIASRR